MTAAPLPTREFEFIGGWLCLDFANTIGDRNNPLETNELEAYADLAMWSVQADLLTPERAEVLMELAQQHPDDAHAALERAIHLRETIYAVFTAIAAGDQSDSDALTELNRFIAEARSRMALVPTENGFGWAWRDEQTLDGMIWRVAWSAAELLLSEQHTLVRECSADNCTFLFVDTSRNHSRRWCDMRSCGNRAKARRHYDRSRGDSMDEEVS